MKTDFYKFRKWRHYQVSSAKVLVVLAVADIVLSVFSGFGRHNNWITPIIGLVVAIASFKMLSCSRCTHCGKSVMSKWLGRDAAGRNCTKRIEKRQPILCFHCVQEVDTD
ncbi:MAG: hypothetical protein IJU44_07755 [Kiritimatiellae bacterium]|nr:hypothetical protein [Kiritimatiellia bacterium]